MSLSETVNRRPTAQVIFVRYVLFAIIAGTLNLLTQELVFQILPYAALVISILAGTAIGFVVKFILDKRWIFDDPHQGHSAEAKKVAIYGVFSVGTTVIFWGVELLFLHLFGTTGMKYFGGALGLALGNLIKYRLDKRFVFASKP